MGITETEWISSETELYLWKYYFKASLIVDIKSVIRLFARIDSMVNMAHFNNVYVRFSPGPMRRIGRPDLERNEHKHC